MSSYFKDARWALCRKVLDATSIDSVNDLSYEDAEKLLGACQSVLDYLPRDEIEKIAKGF